MKKKWIINLLAILFANQIITNAFTSYMLFYLIYKRKLIFLMETCYLIWKNLFTKEIENRNKLI